MAIDVRFRSGGKTVFTTRVDAADELPITGDVLRAHWIAGVDAYRVTGRTFEYAGAEASGAASPTVTLDAVVIELEVVLP